MEPADESTAATRLLDRANALLAQSMLPDHGGKACTAGGNQQLLGNDAMRAKLLADLAEAGNSWKMKLWTQRSISRTKRSMFRFT
jgi:hypothetical protein